MKDISRSIVGILGVPTYDDENDPVIALYNDYKNVIVKKGCIPFMICPVLCIDYYGVNLNDIPKLTIEEKEIYVQMINICDGIVLPGGYRIYDFEKYIAKTAIEMDMPILGICKGMQLLATIDNEERCVVKNETLIEHRQSGVKYAHKLNILKSSLLYDIIKKEEIGVNSKHRYHVDRVNKFAISAYSEDGLIEGIELPEKSFVVGTQWHPEKMIDYDENANKLFDRFIDECAKVKVKKRESSINII